MTRAMSRRRFLAVSAAAAVLPGAASAAPPVAEWRGVALGADASMRLVGVTNDGARDTFAALQAELDRLEGLFSLHRDGSALARLNREGRLAAPPPEMLELLSLAGAIHDSTNGAFDPTVQPLWALYAETFGRLPDAGELAKARARTGWADVRIGQDAIGFARPGMSMTLNGIAQGYVTDRVAALLRGRGYSDVLIDMGEIAALGHRPDGSAWRVGIAAAGGRVVCRTTLSDRALATSAPMGTALGDGGGVGHILDPRRGAPAATRALVSVSADRAALADALSTAFCLMDDAAIAAALKLHPEARIEVARDLLPVA